jgi:hypothetical protein
LTARRDQANPPSVPLTTKPDPPATVQRFYPGPLTQFQSGVDRVGYVLEYTLEFRA